MSLFGRNIKKDEVLEPLAPPVSLTPTPTPLDTTTTDSTCRCRRAA